ncbi:anthrone oxygenase family protein [Flindersiella endophytica]
MNGLLFGFVLLTAIVYGLVSGAFYAFSSFVMQGLGRIPAPQGIAAMQGINITAVRPPFMLGFSGAVLLSIVAVVIAVVRWGKPGSVWLIVGAVLYVVGCFALTMAFNVPLNNALATVDPATPEAAELWTRYLRVWTNWNTVRTIAAAAASAAFVKALVS